MGASPHMVDVVTGDNLAGAAYGAATVKVHAHVVGVFDDVVNDGKVVVGNSGPVVVHDAAAVVADAAAADSVWAAIAVDGQVANGDVAGFDDEPAMDTRSIEGAGVAAGQGRH